MDDDGVSHEDVISREIIRKLRLATEAETKEDREIICEEVFCDITGPLDDVACEKLGVQGYTSFYEVLAPYYLRDSAAADTLLYFCRRLWGQPYVAPVFALLLHRWLLLRPEAGGVEQRQKHVNVLMQGSRQLFLGDVASGVTKLRPLYSFLCHGIALAANRQPLDGLPASARTQLLAVVAAFSLYYEPRASLKQLLVDFPSPTHTLADGGHAPGEGADLILGEAADLLAQVHSEQGLITYMAGLQALAGSEQLKKLRSITKLRLQAELYALTSPGGPHYAPRAVRVASGKVLDALFPLGKRSRRLVRLLFRMLHPADWLSGAWLLLLPVRLWSWLYARAIGAVLMALVALFNRLRGAGRST